MGGIWFVSYFAGYENPNLPGIKSFTALPKGALHESPGQRPGYRDEQNQTALKGRHKPPEPILHLVLLVMNAPPFQGWVGVAV